MAETIKGINIKLGLDGKDLDNELKGITKELKEQQKDLKAINANLKFDSNNIELWQRKQQQLNNILNHTKQKLEVQNQQLAKAREGLKLGTVSEQEFRRLERNISYTEAELKSVNNELDKANQKIKDLGNQKWDNLGNLGSSLTKSLTVPIMAAVTALGVLATTSANTAEELRKTALKLGLSIEALQEWNHVARITGVETSSLERGFLKINNILADIALGDVRSFAGVFHALGIQMDDLAGKGTEEAFFIIGEALSKVEDAALRTALANHIFGDRLGTELIPILSLQTDTIEDLREQARQLGIITTEQSEISKEYKDELTKLKQATTALAMEISMQLYPALTRLVELIIENVIPAIRGVVDWWNNLSDGTKKLIVVLIALAAAIGPIITIIAKVAVTLKVLAVALKGVGVAGTIAGIGIKAATLGIGALIAIVIAALMQSEAFKELLMKLFTTLMRLLDPIFMIVEAINGALQPVLDIIMRILGRLIDVLTPLIDILLRPLIGILEIIGNLFERLSPLIELVGRILESVLVPAFEALETILEPIFKVLEKIIGFFEKVFGFAAEVGEKMGNALGGIGDKFKGVISGIGNFVSNTTSKIGNFAKNALGTVKDVASNVGSKVGGFFGKVGGWFSNTFNLKGNSNSNSTNTSNTSNTTNQITINTTASTFDVDSINKELGGKFI